jgi:hypothetical protein
MNHEHVDSLCVFLKLLYEETKDKTKVLSLQKLSSEYKLPYARSISKVLVTKGILTVSVDKEYNKRSYLWSTSTEPNRKMAEAIIIASRVQTTHYNQNTINKESSIKPIAIETKPVTLIDNVQTQINELKTKLISIGFTKEQAIEIIINQIK